MASHFRSLRFNPLRLLATFAVGKMPSQDLFSESLRFSLANYYSAIAKDHSSLPLQQLRLSCPQTFN
jgi:hypothetical protein